MPRIESQAEIRRRVQAEYMSARAAKRGPAKMDVHQVTRTSPSDSPEAVEEDFNQLGEDEREEPEEEEMEEAEEDAVARVEQSSLPRGTVIEREFFDWKGDKLDVKITEKAVVFEGKRYTGHKWNTAIDLIMARAKKPSTKKKPSYLLNWTDAEIAADEKKKAAAAKAKVKAKANREETAARQAQRTRDQEKANKGGLLNWMTQTQ